MEEYPLYSSRITKSYIEYLNRYYPGVNVNAVLDYAGMTSYQLEDGGHWFTQSQINRFHEALHKAIDNPHFARDVGRSTPFSQAAVTISRITMGLVNPSSAYTLMERLYPRMSRACEIQTRNINQSSVEIIVRAKKGVTENPFQCDNRIGVFEAIAKLFTNKYANIEHPACMHRNADHCRYLISWDETPSLFWKKIRTYSIIFSCILSSILFFVLPTEGWAISTLCLLSSILAISSYSSVLGEQELSEALRNEGNLATNVIDQINVGYNNAVIIQEIGQAASRILDIDKLLKYTMGTLEKRLDFDRGMIMLANRERNRLLYTVGYGYTQQIEAMLKNTKFHLDKPHSKGEFVVSFKEQRPFLVSDVKSIEKNLSERSIEFLNRMDTRSFICVPIVYEGRSEGILAVDNVRSQRELSQSDLSLLLGIAPQLGICINNARSYQLIREREESFRALSENAPDIIYTIDTDGTLTYVNPAWEGILGYEKSEVIGKYFIDFARKEDARTYINLFKTVRDTKKTIKDVSGILLHKNGTERLFNMNGAPNLDSDGNVTGLVGIFKDITEQHNLEIELRQAQKMQAIGTLSGGIAHDFNNILTPIIGYTELLVSESSTQNQTRWMLERILNASYRAKELVQQILTFSRQQTEQERKPIQISPIVKEALKLLRASLPATIEIKQNIDSKSLVLGDPTQIHQVLMNLCTNAGHAMHDRGGILEVNINDVYLDSESAFRLSDVSPGSYVRLTVSDTGCGMMPEIKERVFEPFFTTKERSKGTGMGLSVVHGIIENYGGTITVYSEPDIGSTFNVYFPVFIDETRPLADIRKPAVMGSERILFVDDEKPVVEIGKHVLESLGYHVTTSTSSTDALALFKAQSNNFDLVITDMTMPNMTGDKLAEAIMSVRPDIPIIICTGYSTGMTKEKAEMMGIRAYVMKPLLKTEIAQTIRSVLADPQVQ